MSVSAAKHAARNKRFRKDNNKNGLGGTSHKVGSNSGAKAAACANNITSASSADATKVVEITNSDMISLCAPFNLPDDTRTTTYILAPDRYPKHCTLEGVYGSLTSSIPNLAATQSWDQLGKSKLINSLLESLTLVDTQTTTIHSPVPKTPIQIPMLLDYNLPSSQVANFASLFNPADLESDHSESSELEEEEEEESIANNFTDSIPVTLSHTDRKSVV